MENATLSLCEKMKLTSRLKLIVEFPVEKFFTGNTMYDFVSPRNTNVVHVVLSNDVRKMKSEIVENVRKLQFVNDDLLEELKEVKAYSVNVIVYGKWLTKQKKLKKIDLTNIWKPVEDAIMESLGLDDSLCIEEKLSKGDDDILVSNKIIAKFELYK